MLPKLMLYTLLATVLLAAPAYAQDGHFIVGGANSPTCTDVGTTLSCDGKVAGLGGTTFEVTVEAEGLAEVQCRNKGGNVASGQDTSVDATGTTGPIPTPANGHFTFTLDTVAPTVPNVPTCPNKGWTAEVIDVVFGPATFSLFEDNLLVDQVTVLVTE